MGYRLEALVLDTDAAQGWEKPKIFLAQNLYLVPLTGEFLQDLGTNHDPYAEFFWKLSAPVERLARDLSLYGRVAYIEADYFGGIGAQAALTWRAGEVVLGPLKTQGRGAINAALAALGVVKGQAFDEFDAVNLGRYRNTEAWLREARGV